MMPVQEDSVLVTKKVLMFNEFVEHKQRSCVRSIRKTPELLSSEFESIVKKSKANAFGKVNTGGDIVFEKVSKDKYRLTITGSGHDNRCRWCKSFGTILCHLTIDFGRGEVKSYSVCRYGI